MRELRGPGHLLNCLDSVIIEIKKCPVCLHELRPTNVDNIAIESCKQCKGLWFDYDELRKIKDLKMPSANWFDVDLWSDESKFQGEKSNKICSKCEITFYKLKYGESEIEIDACKKCKGIWLDRGEFEKILSYVKTKWTSEILNNYTKNLASEGKEIFTGPENLRSEVADVRVLMDLFKYKFMTENQTLGRILIHLPII